MSNYFSFDCPITFTITSNPLINKLSTYFYISSSITTNIGTFTITISVTDGVNTITDSFILTASYNCATDARIVASSTTTFYEVGDTTLSCYT